MAHASNWKRLSKVVAAKAPGSGLDAELAQVDRACREVAFCELANAIALSRIEALRGAVRGCETEIAAQPGTRSLWREKRTLEAELASFEETLPIEFAYRADQRDMALSRLGAAQERLRALGVSDDRRVRAALALSPESVVCDLRRQAVLRLAAL